MQTPPSVNGATKASAASVNATGTYFAGASSGETRKTAIAATPEIANQQAWRANSSPTRSVE